MDTEQKRILRELVREHNGSMPVIDFVHKVANGDQVAVRNLKANGYIDIDEYRTATLMGYNDVSYYFATRKGRVRLQGLRQRMWFNVTENPTAYIGLATIIVSMITLALTIIFSSATARREALSFQLQNRPYVVMDDLKPSAVTSSGWIYTLVIKNVGVLPAKIDRDTIACVGDTLKEYKNPNLIGAGEKLNTTLNIPLLANNQELNCEFTIFYSAPIGIPDSQKDYSTGYVLQIDSSGNIAPLNASMN